MKTIRTLYLLTESEYSSLEDNKTRKHNKNILKKLFIKPSIEARALLYDEKMNTPVIIATATEDFLNQDDPISKLSEFCKQNDIAAFGLSNSFKKTMFFGRSCDLLFFTGNSVCNATRLIGLYNRFGVNCEVGLALPEKDEYELLCCATSLFNFVTAYSPNHEAMMDSARRIYTETGSAIRLVLYAAELINCDQVLYMDENNSLRSNNYKSSIEEDYSKDIVSRLYPKLYIEDLREFMCTDSLFEAMLYTKKGMDFQRDFITAFEYLKNMADVLNVNT